MQTEPPYSNDISLVPKKYIAFLGCDRFTTVVETVSALLKCSDIHEYHFLVFLDRPRNDEGIEGFLSIQSFLLNNVDVKKFKSFSLQVSDENLGVWNSKLKIFSISFELGSDFTLLLEDDVLLKPDALEFCSLAYNFIINSVELITLSLYSTNLVAIENVSYSKALKFVCKNQNVFHEWGLRRWPFPWGLGLTKRAHHLFTSLGWNGNDQNMGQLLSEAKGYDLFPIISRSDHIGKSKSENGKFRVVKHLDFEDSHYQNRNFQMIGESREQIQRGIQTANHFFVQLKNDLALVDNRVKIWYGDSIFLEKINEFKDLNTVLDIDVSFIDPLWFNDVDSIKIYDIISRISAHVTVLLFTKNAIQDFIISELKNKPTKFLIGLEGEKIFEALRS